MFILLPLVTLNLLVLLRCDLLEIAVVIGRLLEEKLLLFLNFIVRLAHHLEAGKPVIIYRLGPCGRRVLVHLFLNFSNQSLNITAKPEI